MDDDADGPHQGIARPLAGARCHCRERRRRGIADVRRILDDADAPVPGQLRRMLALLTAEVREIESQIDAVERELRAIAEEEPVTARLMAIPGGGLLTATALVASVPHIHGFQRGPRFAS